MGAETRPGRCPGTERAGPSGVGGWSGALASAPGRLLRVLRTFDLGADLPASVQHSDHDRKRRWTVARSVIP